MYDDDDDDVLWHAVLRTRAMYKIHLSEAFGYVNCTFPRALSLFFTMLFSVSNICNSLLFDFISWAFVFHGIDIYGQPDVENILYGRA